MSDRRQAASRESQAVDPATAKASPSFPELSVINIFVTIIVDDPSDRLGAATLDGM
jgi:hypothetical protein